MNIEFTHTTRCGVVGTPASYSEILGSYLSHGFGCLYPDIVRFSKFSQVHPEMLLWISSKLSDLSSVRDFSVNVLPRDCLPYLLRNAYEDLAGKPSGKKQLKRVLQNRCQAWIGLNWLRILTSNYFLYTRKRTFGFHKRRETSRITEWFLPSQIGLSSLESVGR
jgi:hypothetical protein